MLPGYHVTLYDDKNILYYILFILTFSVLEPPRASVSPSYETVDIGDSIEFRCSVTGYPTPTITWKRGGGRKLLPDTATTEGAYLRLKHIQSEDEGDYICTAKNDGGVVRRRGLLYVRGNIYSLFQKYKTVCIQCMLP